jgi:osmoprotectant transport system ATP-binding protein
MHPTDDYLRFREVGKSFGGNRVLDDFNLSIHQGEVFVLLGPSGCGKSTALQLANRLLECDAGIIEIAGQDVSELDPVEVRRRIGYVIQQVGLFPHRTVAANVGTVCRLLNWTKAATRDRVETLLDLVGLPIDEFGGRYPHELSGGQQQRVGVARALAVDPPLLLLDEPFAALDPQIRRSLQVEFRSWVERLGTTVLFVSHDVDEALILADRMGVMGSDGQLAQVGTPLEVLASPANDSIRDFLGPDRALKRLSVTPIDVRALEPSSDPAAPAVPQDATLQAALLTLLTLDVPVVNVVTANNQIAGELSLPDIGRQARLADAWS